MLSVSCVMKFNTKVLYNDYEGNTIVRSFEVLYRTAREQGKEELLRRNERCLTKKDEYHLRKYEKQMVTVVTKGDEL